MKVKETIEHINKYIQAQGYYFEKGTVENLYLSLRSKPFVILFGPNGCGKHSLIRLFCESIGVTAENGRFKFVSVSEGYTQKEFIGYRKEDGTFAHGEITEFIYKALNDSENPYFIYLDDMNMSDPDCYLSPLFKAMDTRRYTADNRLTSESILPGEYFEKSSKYIGLTYPDNLYIVGGFSPADDHCSFSLKIKDRANIIDLGAGDIGVILNKSSQALDSVCVKNEFLKPKYLNAFESDEEEFMKITSFVLKDINKNLGFIRREIGYRTRNEILFYLIINKEYDLIGEDEAFDNVLMQRVLTRIEGSEAYVKTILSTLFKLCIPRGVGDYAANSLKMFRSLSYLECRYPKSAHKITFMTRRHEEHGNCTFFNA